MSKMKYCTKCMNQGIDIDGNPCSCKFNVKSFYDTVSCLDIPEQYRGVQFNRYLVPKDLHESYEIYLTKLHEDICAMRFKSHNICLCSPILHSKTILAYSCIEYLFRYGVTTFPVFDVLELKRIMLDTDLCRKQFYEVKNPENLILAPIVFAKIPRVPTWEVYDTISVILDRRVRRGNSTIFIYDGTWEQLIRNDRQNILSGLMGDGNYNTIDVKNWIPPIVEEKPEVPEETNIG